MPELSVFDPPMCCSTGVCGPSVDPALPRFAADLEWLQTQGVTVKRFSLSQQPQAFVENEAVRAALTEEGNGCLPLILVNGEIVSRGKYLSRDELLRLSGGQANDSPSIYTAAVAELVALGVSMAANCERCFKFHFAEAKKLGVSCADMARAARTAQKVKDAPAEAIWEMANRFLACAVEPGASLAAPADHEPVAARTDSAR